MRIGRLTNDIANELEMQSVMFLWLQETKKPFAKEITVKEVNRRADFLVLDDTRLINIEAKSTQMDCLINQLKDHAKYCDYCFAFIPDFAPTPKWFKEELLRNGFGLILFNTEHKTITEALEAHQNKEIDRKLRHTIFEKVKKQYKNGTNSNTNNGQ